MRGPRPPRSGRLPLALVAVITLIGGGCSSTSPSPDVTTTPPTSAPTAPPTPAATFRPLTAADLGTGWTLLATDTNIDGIPRIVLLGTVKVGIKIAFECVGTGTAKISLAAAGGRVTIPPEGANDFFTATYPCPTLVVVTVPSNDYDEGGVSISPNVDASEGLTYELTVGTSG